MKSEFLQFSFSTRRHVGSVILFLILNAALPSNAGAQIVWNSGSLTFTKANFANADLPANQDRITGNVWITRRDVEGIFNIHNETAYIRNVGATRSSPSDTEWSFGSINNYSTLTYTDWETWFNQAPANILNADAVVHLISENIYIGIRFLSWTQRTNGGGFSYTRTTQSTLPVNLVSFSAKVKDKKVMLDWTTAQEQNSSFFQIERSMDGKNYNPVSSVKAAGNSTLLQSYAYTDINPVRGINYYRLKQTDQDGRYVYSNVVALNFTDKKNSIILNRSAGIVYITNNEGNTMEVQLFSNSGVLLKKEKILSNSAQFSVREFPQGIYIIKVTGNRNSYAEKLFKP